MRNIAFAIVLGLSSFAVAGCAGAEHPAAVSLPAGAKMPGEAKVGDKTICPVSHEEFTVTAESPKVELNGKTYYTCCPGCAKKLQAEPQKYLDQLPKPTT